MSDIKFVDRQDSINLATQFGEYLYNRLPKVYRDYDVEIERLNVETQKKETFKTLQEYLYSFALGGFQPLLEDLEAIINLVDPFKCPSEFLPYLLRHFGLDYIDDIPEKFQRRLVQNVVTLYKKKGTIPAVAFLAKELSGFDVKIEEKSDGSIEFALIKLNAYEDEDAELLLAQDVIQRYIHLFLPAQTKSKIIVVYGFTENIHINPNCKSEDTTYDHAYYDVDEYEDITYIDENGYDSKTGGYSEAFDYLKHVVEDDFNALKLKLEEENHNFSPSLPDLTSLTNCVENDGLPMFTNGISCEDTITEQTLTSTTGEVEFNIPASASNISVNKLVGGVDYAVLPIYKCTTDLLKGTTLEFKYDGKSYGYYTLERDLYASENFPTTFQLDIYNNMVKVYNQYFVETIDESYDFTLHSGYGSYYASMKNGFVATGLISDIRIKCDYDKDFTVMDSIYFQPITTPRIAFYLHNVYISLSNVITSEESATEFVKSYPITIISPCAKDGSGSDSNTSPTGQTIAYKKLSNTPVSGSTTIECTIYTMNDRKTVFAYESPVFTQNSNIAISGYYGLKTFPESHIIGDNIQVTGHLTGVSLIDYKIYGNSTQETRISKNLFSGFVKGVGLNQLTGVEYTDSTCAASDYIAVDFNKNPNYTFSGTRGVLDVNIFAYNSNKEYLGRCHDVGTVHLNTSEFKYDTTGVGGDIVYLRVSAMEHSELSGTIDDIDTWRVQLEIGKISTEDIIYEPYGNMPSPEFPSEVQSVGDLVTDEASEHYGKYDIPITVSGKNLLPNSDWMSGTHSTGFTEEADVDYITEYTQNSISFNLTAWKGVSSPRFKKDSVNRIVFKINQNQINSDDGYINFYISIQGYDNDNNKIGNATIYNNAVADTAYVFDISAISAYDWYANSTQFSFCVLTRKNVISNLMVYDIAYYAETDTSVYEPYIGETKHIYLDEPLRKIGDYADYIDFKNQKVIRQTTFRTFDGTENFAGYSMANGFFYDESDMKSQKFGYGYCNYYLRITSVRYVGIRFGVDNNTLYFCNVYTDAEPLTVAEWKEKLSNWNANGNPLIVYYVLDTPIEELIEVPDIITTDTNTMYMYLGTSIQPSSIDITYYENTPVPKLSEIVYDLGIPLVSFDGYSESIEKIDGKYYLRSAIKEIPLEYMYSHCSAGGGSDVNGYSYVNWFSIKSISFSEKTPFYFNMSPCMSNVKPFNTHTYDKESSKYVPLPNYVDVFDFICFYYGGGSGSSGNYSNKVNVNQLRCLSGYNLKYGGLEPFKHIYNNMFRYSDVPPKFYIYDKYNKYGGETLTEITDKEVINKLNLLPIPEDYAIISSKGIKYSSMDVSVQSKRYY